MPSRAVTASGCREPVTRRREWTSAAAAKIATHRQLAPELGRGEEGAGPQIQRGGQRGCPEVRQSQHEEPAEQQQVTEATGVRELGPQQPRPRKREQGHRHLQGRAHRWCVDRRRPHGDREQQRHRRRAEHGRRDDAPRPCSIREPCRIKCRRATPRRQRPARRSESGVVDPTTNCRSPRRRQAPRTSHHLAPCLAPKQAQCESLAIAHHTELTAEAPSSFSKSSQSFLALGENYRLTHRRSTGRFSSTPGRVSAQARRRLPGRSSA